MKDHLYSKGCQHCQSGGWLCIFLTYLCDAGCSFCPSPHSDDRVVTELGSSIEEVLSGLEKWDYRGISFSGGDPFLVYPRLKNWLQTLHAHHPDCYFWAYTSGLHATRERMLELSQLGMKEIRFNIAATGYDHPVILERLGQAAQIFEHTAVEIPSIPEHFDQLIKVLPKIDDLGVEFLNLHEFILSPDEASSCRNAVSRSKVNYCGELLCDAKSCNNTDRIAKYCRQHGINLKINSCTTNQKEHQMLRRRILWAERLKEPWEKVTKSGLLATSVRTEDLEKLSAENDPSSTFLTSNSTFYNPEECEGLEEYQTVLFLPPMEIYGERKYLGSRDEME